MTGVIDEFVVMEPAPARREIEDESEAEGKAQGPGVGLSSGVDASDGSAMVAKTKQRRISMPGQRASKYR